MSWCMVLINNIQDCYWRKNLYKMKEIFLLCCISVLIIWVVITLKLFNVRLYKAFYFEIDYT